ncbi:MAG: Tyrosine-protein kinase EpsD [uncultured Sulfurovum sp.]|uniref:non-specific protein-tyrosine kinase n=1 Tax=uncultured Sulfurovum sp. TaxID=269237 RepID=A0A6S6T2R9_9BACT|nr:MAG: Tyrosine-protein kinase EpsD [uncultured Sulfurovum sp.]
MQTTQIPSSNPENYIVELFKTILPYKWSILFITLISIIMANLYLYFIAPTYESRAIIKIKINNDVQATDLLRDSLNNTNTVGIKQEILSLKTYKINRKVLEEIDFSIQYFQKENYKMVELYDSSPLNLKLNKESDFEVIKQVVTVTSKKNGFTLSTKELGESIIYPFNTQIQTPYFSGSLIQKKPFLKPIQIVLNGNSRSIYESIIRKKLFVKQIDPDANLIQISFQDTIPKRANAYVNALVKIYMTQNFQKKDQTNSKVLSFLDLQLNNIKEKLEKSEDGLEQYKTLNNVEPTVQVKDSFDKLSAIDLDLSELTLKEKLAKNLIRFVQNNQNLDAIGPTLLEFNDATTIKFINSLEELQQQEDELALEFTDRYPKLINIRKRIQRIKSKILLNVKNLRSTLISKRVNLEKRKKKYEKILKELPQKEKKLISFQRDYEVNSKMYSYLLEKKSENELLKVASISDYEIIDQAYTSSRPIKPKRLIFLIAMSIIGFIFAIFISLLRALLLDKIAKHRDIELLTKLPIYGIIPLYHNVMFSTIKLKEAYHKLATNLQFSKKEAIGSIILLSSKTQGEGKTTTVVNLAGVFQNSQYKTIVIDLNMRTPTLHNHFGIEQQYSGMSTYLSQRDNIGNIIFSTNYQNLDIIPSGPIPPNPSQLVFSNRLNELLEILKNKYDYIIIDTSAYDTAIETLYLMKFTSINLVVLKEKVSKKSSIIELEQIIQEKNLVNMGLVLKSIIKDEKQQDNDLLTHNFISKKDERVPQTPIQLSL